MKWTDIWGDKALRVHSDYTLSYAITSWYIENKFEKTKKIYVSGESDDEGAFTISEFSFS
jgi:hypothetical protein